MVITRKLYLVLGFLATFVSAIYFPIFDPAIDIFYMQNRITRPTDRFDTIFIAKHRLIYSCVTNCMNRGTCENPNNSQEKVQYVIWPGDEFTNE